MHYLKTNYFRMLVITKYIPITIQTNMKIILNTEIKF